MSLAALSPPSLFPSPKLGLYFEPIPHVLIDSYDPNDLALDTFTSGIISKELSAIIARPFTSPEIWVFSDLNKTLGGDDGLGAGELQYKGVEEVKRGLR